MYLETMQQIFSSTSKVMMDAKSGNNMIYLPLDKMVPQQAPATAPTASASVATEQIPTVEMRFSKDGRPRDARDPRDREVR
jgi:membrane protease subunit HflK